MQPATGAKDLNPQQVETNHLISNRLSKVFELWGYEEVSPPRIERIPTLMAGGAISSKQIVRLVADEPLGLRPEMTASIARTACTRLAKKKRPLRLWASGTIFETRETIEQGLCIEENLVCGVELFGVKGIEAELELLSLLNQSLETLELKNLDNPILLIGHTALMDLILKDFHGKIKEEAKKALLRYDRLSIEKLNIEKDQKNWLIQFQNTRGNPTDVIKTLKTIYGESEVLRSLERMFLMIEPLYKSKGIALQLDPTFHPQFDLYKGIVFQLICNGQSAPIVIARGGRYDSLVEKFSTKGDNSAGIGFSFAIDKIREIQIESAFKINKPKCILIAYGPNSNLETAIQKQIEYHRKGYKAILELESIQKEEDAKLLLSIRGCSQLEWLKN